MGFGSFLKKAAGIALPLAGAATGNPALAALGSAAGGAIGGGEAMEGQGAQGFYALPKSVQDSWLNSYMPAAQAEFEKAYTPVPLAQYTTPASDPFYSQGMADLQAHVNAQQPAAVAQPMAVDPEKEAMKAQIQQLQQQVTGVPQFGFRGLSPYGQRMVG